MEVVLFITCVNRWGVYPKIHSHFRDAKTGMRKIVNVYTHKYYIIMFVCYIIHRFELQPDKLGYITLGSGLGQ
jgi:hypothetical protein